MYTADPTRRGFAKQVQMLQFARITPWDELENSARSQRPNVVPLIDILLVLIIIFMVITPLFEGLDTPASAESNQQQNIDWKTKPLSSRLPRRQIKINQEDSSFDQLGPRTSKFSRARGKDRFVKAT